MRRAGARRRGTHEPEPSRQPRAHQARRDEADHLPDEHHRDDRVADLVVICGAGSCVSSQRRKKSTTRRRRRRGGGEAAAARRCTLYVRDEGPARGISPAGDDLWARCTCRASAGRSRNVPVRVEPEREAASHEQQLEGRCRALRKGMQRCRGTQNTHERDVACGRARSKVSNRNRRDFLREQTHRRAP